MLMTNAISMDLEVKGISGRFELERQKALAGDMRRERKMGALKGI